MDLKTCCYPNWSFIKSLTRPRADREEAGTPRGRNVSLLMTKHPDTSRATLYNTRKRNNHYTSAWYNTEEPPPQDRRGHSFEDNNIQVLAREDRF